MQDKLTDFGFRFDNSYALLDEKLYTKLNPVPVANPSVVLWNNTLAKELGLKFTQDNHAEISKIFSGNQLPGGATPMAQAYAGHQFGHFTMLGDGRAIVLGEQITPEDKRFDIQLKGSGQTPYSRRGDGRATLYSMLREYLISEAMYFLGIPTSRSLAVVSTGEKVYRETTHPGAVLTRVASGHIRIGTFEYVSYYHENLLLNFTEYTIKRHYPELLDAENPPLELLRRVMQQQARLIAQWMQVGFIHGVMNTDNTGIAAETFDYGPCAFINEFDQKKVFSSIDHYGRYAFGSQPGIIHWNLGCFASTLLPLLHQNKEKAIELARNTLDEFESIFSEAYVGIMCRKLGIEKPRNEDGQLIQDLLKWMQDQKADYTNTFLVIENSNETAGLSENAIYKHTDFNEWILRWKKRMGDSRENLQQAREIMKKNNPFVIPRNHLVEEVLEEASQKNDLQPFLKLIKILSEPYTRRPLEEEYLLPPPEGDAGYQTFCGT